MAGHHKRHSARFHMNVTKLCIGGKVRIIDPWFNVDMPEWQDAWWMVRVAEDYLHSGRHGLRRLEISEALDTMDSLGVEKVILDYNLDDPSPHTLKFAETHPDRFFLSARVDPRSVMTAVHRVREVHKSLPVVMAKVIPFLFDLAPSAACYYPLYAYCAEAGLPISVNTGIPGPPVASACQDPMHLDRVCVDFPDLSVIMAHGADPWWDVAIRLMIKHPGLHVMTSAYRPKYLPESLVRYMQTRGRHKVMFSADHPLLPLETCLGDVDGLGLDPEALDNYLHGNANRVLFGSSKGPLTA